MKKFNFPLDRVMEWRRTQARIEEMKLEAMHGELRALDRRESEITTEHAQAAAQVRSAGAVSGEELAALDAFRRYVQVERVRLDSLREECHQRIAAQTHLLANKKRDVKLLERLRGQRLTAWTADLERETQQQAEEAFLARWNRSVE